MYKTVYYFLACYMATASSFNGFDCTESQIFMTERLCDYQNGSEDSRHLNIFSDDIHELHNMTSVALGSHGCPLEFETVDLDDEFYVQCLTEIDCVGDDDEEDTTIKIMHIFSLECENATLSYEPTKKMEFVNEGALKEADASTREDDSFDSRKLAIVTGSVAAGLATVAGVAAALYKLQTILQSGSYLFPNTAAPPGFAEMP